MEQVNVILDIILIGTAIWMVYVARRIGGLIGRAFTYATWGIIVLGIAHIVETVTFSVLTWSTDFVEFTHRLIVLTGFVFLILAFKKIKKIST